MVQVVGRASPRGSRTDQTRALRWKLVPCTGKVAIRAEGSVHCHCNEKPWDAMLRRHSPLKEQVQNTGN